MSRCWNISQDSRGFTLSEVMVTVAIAGLLTLLATFAIQPFYQNFNLKEQAQEIRDSVALARNVARFQSSCSAAVFSPGSLSIYMNDGGVCAYPFPGGTTTPVQTTTVPAGITLSPASVAIVFGPDGGYVSNTPFQATLSSQTFVYTLEVFPVTGIVRLK